MHALAYGLPADARLFGDKAYTSAADEASLLAATGVRLAPIRRANRQPHDGADDSAVQRYRHGIATVNSQREALDVQRLHVRSPAGLTLKVQASRIAVAITNVD